MDKILEATKSDLKNNIIDFKAGDTVKNHAIASTLKTPSDVSGKAFIG